MEGEWFIRQRETRFWTRAKLCGFVNLPCYPSGNHNRMQDAPALGSATRSHQRRREFERPS